MEIFVGTSGWLYSWNEGGDFRWFVEHAGLNTVELNASFYCFPFPSQVKSWAALGSKLRWSVKVNRLVTHVFKFSERGLDSWTKFRRLFESLDSFVDFYLFQLPPVVTPKMADKIGEFADRTGLERRFALEFRNEKWFTQASVGWAREHGITIVSVDAPELPKEIYNNEGFVYLRMHGRSGWYSHYYTEEELREVADRIRETKPEKVYIYFNNNSGMLENARSAMEIFKSAPSKINTLAPR